MLRVRGMTIKEFNDILNDMHSIYPFKPESTQIVSLEDIRTNTIRQVEILTTDEDTGVDIVMTKGIERGD